jgi:hypothetical protein
MKDKIIYLEDKSFNFYFPKTWKCITDCIRHVLISDVNHCLEEIDKEFKSDAIPKKVEWDLMMLSIYLEDIIHYFEKISNELELEDYSSFFMIEEIFNKIKEENIFLLLKKYTDSHLFIKKRFEEIIDKIILRMEMIFRLLNLIV